MQLPDPRPDRREARLSSGYGCAERNHRYVNPEHPNRKRNQTWHGTCHYGRVIPMSTLHDPGQRETRDRVLSHKSAYGGSLRLRAQQRPRKTPRVNCRPSRTEIPATAFQPWKWRRGRNRPSAQFCTRKSSLRYQTVSTCISPVGKGSPTHRTVRSGEASSIG